MKRRTSYLAAAIGLALFGASCGDDSSTSTGAASDTTAVSSTATSANDLTANCPNPFIIQKDWIAEVEHAPIYELIGPNGKMSENTYEGPLGDTGLTLKIVDGGPGLGEGQTVISSLFTGNLKTNDTPTMAFVMGDDAATFSKQFPVVGVVSPLNKSPQMLFWDPATYPNGFHTLDDLKAFARTGNKIYVSSIKETYGKWLVDQGVPESAFIQGYAGDAENFVTNGGKWLNQGYASNELYDFEHGRGWAKPIDYTLVNDLGYDFYPSVLSVAKDKLDDLTPCLEKIVPMIQRATVDYVKNPGPINEMLAKYNEQGHGAAYWKTPLALNDAGVEVMVNDKIIANEGASIGGFDMARIQRTIDTVSGGFDDRSNKNVKPQDIATNQFIDPSISLK
jgi:hypothetical protein